MATKIIFLILPNTHLMDLAGPDQVFLEAIDFGADLKIEYCSYANNISTSAGLPFGKVRHFSKVNYKKGDLFLVLILHFYIQQNLPNKNYYLAGSKNVMKIK